MLSAHTLSGCLFGTSITYALAGGYRKGIKTDTASQTDFDDGLRVWRSFQMGKLLDLIILDTRNYDRSITSLGESIIFSCGDHASHRSN